MHAAHEGGVFVFNANSVDYLYHCSFGNIILNNTNAKERADFYIPSHKIEIEVDGRQHTVSHISDFACVYV
jgi:hypothetical protein